MDPWIFILYFGFCTWGILFCRSAYSSFGHWEFFQLPSLSLGDIPSWRFQYIMVTWDFLHFVLFFLFIFVVLCLVLNTFILSGTIRCSGLILFISCPIPTISYFSKERWFILLENNIRNQDLSSRCIIVIFKWLNKH